uniref:Eyes absent homolog n=1 Tax=Strongyloides venezuelensis TaxID=75913 RepID=A0A0K0F667_STRVS
MLRLDNSTTSSSSSSTSISSQVKSIPFSSSVDFNSLQSTNNNNNSSLSSSTEGVWSVLDSAAFTSNITSNIPSTNNLSSMTKIEINNTNMPAISASQSTNPLSVMQDAAVAAGYDPRMLNTSSYYNNGYNPSNYTSYNSAFTTSNYNVSSNSNLRNNVTATATPFANYFSTNGQTYYPGSGSYPTGFDYSYATAAAAGVSAQYYNSRNSYYGAGLASVSPNSLTNYTGLTAAMMDGVAAAAVNGSVTPSSTGQLSPFSASLKSVNSSTESKKSKVSKKKKNSINPLQELNFTRVFIWELEDIFIIPTLSPDISLIAKSLRAIVEEIITNGFGVESNDDCEQMNIEDTNYDETIPDLGYQSNESSNLNVGQLNSISSKNGVDWVRKLSTRYQQIKETYNQYKNNVSSLFENSGTTISCNDVSKTLASIEALTNNWIESFRTCLSKIAEQQSSSGNYTNIIITNDTLSSSLAKMLVINIASYVPIENVYSIGKSSRESALDRIQNKFGKKCSYVMISANGASMEVSKKENIPCWKIKNKTDIDAFFMALIQYLL